MANGDLTRLHTEKLLLRGKQICKESHISLSAINILFVKTKDVCMFAMININLLCRK